MIAGSELRRVNLQLDAREQLGGGIDGEQIAGLPLAEVDQDRRALDLVPAALGSAALTSAAGAAADAADLRDSGRRIRRSQTD